MNTMVPEKPATALRTPDGIELHYVQVGSGPYLIFLHGGMSDCYSWPLQTDHFADRFCCISYSRRHASPNRNAPATADHGVMSEAHDLAQFMDALGIAHAHMVGTSYGAFTALAFAMQYPERVDSMVLNEPPEHRWACATPEGRAAYDAFMRDCWQPATDAFAAGEREQAVRVLFNGICGFDVFGTLPPEGREVALRNASYMEALTISSDPFMSLPRERLRQMQVPTLMVRGEHAVPLHRLVNEEILATLPRARQVVIANASHSAPREQTAEFNAQVDLFLAGLAK